MDLQRLKYIIEALRSSSTPDRIVYKNGKEFRREPVQSTSALGNVRNSTNYNRYKKVQNDIGENAVDYDEWMRNQ